MMKTMEEKDLTMARKPGCLWTPVSILVRLFHELRNNVVSKVSECLPIVGRMPRIRPTGNAIPQNGHFDLEVGHCQKVEDFGRQIEFDGSGYCLAGRRGARHRMEDGHEITSKIHGDSTKQVFFEEYDGHGGTESMDLGSDRLAENTKNALKRMKEEEEEVNIDSEIRSSYLNTDMEFLDSSSIVRSLDGQEEAANNNLSPPSQFSFTVAPVLPVSFLPSINIYDIPTDVLDKILFLLDKNSLCRIHCASRWFNARISNPTFCLSYYRQQLHRGLPLHQINWMEDGSNIYKNISTIEWCNPPSRNFNYWPFTHDKKNVFVTASSSSCLGLLCLYGPQCACLYNPTTRSVVVDLPGLDYSLRYTTLAFGLLHSTNELKVVNITYSPNPSCHERCKVLTIPRDLDSGWRVAANPQFNTKHKILTASIESSLYFLIGCHLYHFDLETEQWSEVKLPLAIRSLPLISEFKGNLYLIAKARIHFEVWLLQEQDVWVKMWLLSLHPYCGMLMNPVHHDEEPQRASIINPDDQLKWYSTYDDETHKECVGSRLYNIPYIETWVSLETLYDI